MRTLVVTPMLPPQAASDGGGKHRRARLFLRALAALSTSMEIVYLVPQHLMPLAADAAALDRSQSDFWGVPLAVTLLARATRRETAWNHYGQGILDAAAQPALFPYTGADLLRQVAARLDSGPDIVFADRLDAALAVLGGGRRPRNLLFDVDDLYHKVLWRNLMQGPWRKGTPALALHVPALLRAERRAIAHARLAFVCSEADAAHLRRFGGGGALRVVPNAIVPPARPPGVAPGRRVLFLGSQHHAPNRTAAERLARRVWPLVRRDVPDARLVIAGADSDTLPSRHAGLPGVEYQGFVADLDALYAAARVVCAPIVQGSGTRLKLIEAAAHARPMVSTRIGAEGLAFRDGAEILLRDDDAGLAAACVALLRDDALCHRLGAAARRVMLERYDAAVVERQVAEMVRGARR